MGRYHDWETRLNAYLMEVAQDVESLGAVPCARFAAECVKVQTGVDHYGPFKGKYSTEIGAAKALKKYGAGTLEATFDAHLIRHPAPAFAQRGDIVSDGVAVGVCVGGTALFIADGGLTQIPRDMWTAAWSTESASSE